MSDIDLVRLNFNPQTLLALNVVLGLVMFGVSLELKPVDFKAALATPRLQRLAPVAVLRGMVRLMVALAAIEGLFLALQYT